MITPERTLPKVSRSALGYFHFVRFADDKAAAKRATELRWGFQTSVVRFTDLRSFHALIPALKRRAIFTPSAIADEHLWEHFSDAIQ